MVKEYLFDFMSFGRHPKFGNINSHSYDIKSTYIQTIQWKLSENNNFYVQ